MHNRLNYKCKKYNDKSCKSVNKWINWNVSYTNQFCNKDLNKFPLLFRKGVYPYEYMDNWEYFNETTLPNKESFYSKLNKEHINDEDYAHAQKVCEVFEIKNLGEYHDLYVQSDTLLLADVFENFRDKCLEIYELDPAHFFICSRISMASMFKKDWCKIRVTNW